MDRCAMPDQDIGVIYCFLLYTGQALELWATSMDVLETYVILLHCSEGLWFNYGGECWSVGVLCVTPMSSLSGQEFNIRVNEETMDIFLHIGHCCLHLSNSFNHLIY